MNKGERQEKVWDFVRRKGFASVEDLASHLGVTAQTIRRDIQDLSARGAVRKYHGGAGLASTVENVAYKTRKIQNIEAKRRIGLRTADLIPDGASVFVDTGTTCEAVAEALTRRRNLRVITNNLHVAGFLGDQTDFEVAVPGGVVRNADGAVLGEMAVEFLRQFRVDYAVIGISAVDDDGMLMEYDLREAHLRRVALQQARTALLACDSSKFGRSALVCVGALESVSILVTDALPQGPSAAFLHTGATRVELA